MSRATNATNAIGEEKWKLCKYLIVFTLCSMMLMFLGAQFAEIPQFQGDSQRRRLKLNIKMDPYTQAGGRPSFWSMGPGGAELLYRCNKLPYNKCALKNCNYVNGECTKCGLFDEAACKAARCDWSERTKLCNQCSVLDARDCDSKGCFWHYERGRGACSKTKPKKKIAGGCSHATNTVSCAKTYGCRWSGRACVKRICLGLDDEKRCTLKVRCVWNKRVGVCVDKSDPTLYLTESQMNQNAGVPGDFKLWASFLQIFLQKQFIANII